MVTETYSVNSLGADFLVLRMQRSYNTLHKHITGRPPSITVQKRSLWLDSCFLCLLQFSWIVPFLVPSLLLHRYDPRRDKLSVTSPLSRRTSRIRNFIIFSWRIELGKGSIVYRKTDVIGGESPSQGHRGLREPENPPFFQFFLNTSRLVRITLQPSLDSHPSFY